jgi:hypothetical protein
VVTVVGIERPRLHENAWYIQPGADQALLVTHAGSFEVPVPDAMKFLAMRSHCTGLLSLEQIAARSGLPSEEVGRTLSALADAGVVMTGRADPAPVALPLPEVRQRIVRACQIWYDELHYTSLTRQFPEAGVNRAVLVGWLLEARHLASFLPGAIAMAAERAPAGHGAALRALAEDRRGERPLIESALRGLGFDDREIESSIPLLATRLICLLQQELFAREPFSVWMVEALYQAQVLGADECRRLRQQLPRSYQAAADSLDAWLELQRRQGERPGRELVAAQSHQLPLTDVVPLDDLCNKVHDLRHAFDLLALEVKDYHQDLLGKYLPRQPVDFLSL